MVQLAGFMVLALLSGAAWMFFQRMNELFCVSYRDRKVLVVRGSVPPSLLSDIGEVLRRSSAVSATVRGVRADGRARLISSGVDEGTAQRLRNIFGTYSISRLREAKPQRRRNVGQFLGIAWLAWLIAEFF